MTFRTARECSKENPREINPWDYFLCVKILTGIFCICLLSWAVPAPARIHAAAHFAAARKRAAISDRGQGQEKQSHTVQPGKLPERETAEQQTDQGIYQVTEFKEENGKDQPGNPNHTDTSIVLSACGRRCGWRPGRKRPTQPRFLHCKKVIKWPWAGQPDQPSAPGHLSACGRGRGREQTVGWAFRAKYSLRTFHFVRAKNTPSAVLALVLVDSSPLRVLYSYRKRNGQRSSRGVDTVTLSLEDPEGAPEQGREEKGCPARRTGTAADWVGSMYQRTYSTGAAKTWVPRSAQPWKA